MKEIIDERLQWNIFFIEAGFTKEIITLKSLTVANINAKRKYPKPLE